VKLFWILGLVVFIGLTPKVNGSDVRVKVARLDGAPVYHWRAFKSIYRDDSIVRSCCESFNAKVSWRPIDLSRAN
jgi:hypothetical protein